MLKLLVILLAQLDFYKDLENSVKFLSEFSTHKKFVDLAGFIVSDKNNVPSFSFGKHKGKSVEEVLKTSLAISLDFKCRFPTLHKKGSYFIEIKKMNNRQRKLSVLDKII